MNAGSLLYATPQATRRRPRTRTTPDGAEGLVRQRNRGNRGIRILTADGGVRPHGTMTISWSSLRHSRRKLNVAWISTDLVDGDPAGAAESAILGTADVFEAAVTGEQRGELSAVWATVQ